jgi:hypothetical protein
MSKISDRVELVVREAEAESDDVDAPLPASVKVTRGHDRTKTLQVRLNEDEYRLLAKHADEMMIPLSTFARAVLLRTIGS